MNRTKGFTLIELLIVVAIIVILAVTFLGLLKPRKAGAHEIVPVAVSSIFREHNVSYRWTNDVTPGNVHEVVIMDQGSAGWESPAAACNALVAADPTLTPLKVTLTTATGGGTVEWVDGSDVRRLTNMPTTNSAEC